MNNSSKNMSLEELDKKYILHCQTDPIKHEERGPIIIERGEGVFVYDNHGNRYLEGMAGLWSVGLGFSEKRLGDVAKAQYDKLPFYHQFFHRSTEPAIRLAAKLIEMAPAPMSKVFFGASGSEAIDSVIKLLWLGANSAGQPERKKILARHGSYHGANIAATSVTGLNAMHLGQDIVLPIVRLTSPNFYHEGLAGETEEDFATRLADELEQTIVSEGAHTISCFIAEPIMGAGGVIVPPSTYWEKMQKVLEKYEIVFVVDEVICGFGRTGKMFGTQTYDLRPDVLVFSKQITSSYIPFSAFLVNDRVMKPIYEASRVHGGIWHGFTTCGHPVAAAIALETIRIIEEERLPENAGAMGERLRVGISELAHPLVAQVRGVGLMTAVELDACNVQGTESFLPKDLAILVAERLLANGVVTRPTNGAVLFAPPMIINEGEIDMIVVALMRALDEALDQIS